MFFAFFHYFKVLKTNIQFSTLKNVTFLILRRKLGNNLVLFLFANQISFNFRISILLIWLNSNRSNDGLMYEWPKKFRMSKHFNVWRKKTFLKKIFWLLLIYEGGEKTDDIGTKEIEKKITKIFTKKLLLWECKSQKENILFLWNSFYMIAHLLYITLMVGSASIFVACTYQI